MNIYEKIDYVRFVTEFNSATSLSDLARRLELSVNGKSNNFIKTTVIKLNLDISILKKNLFKEQFYIRRCKTCNKEIMVSKNKTTRIPNYCSKDCINYNRQHSEETKRKLSIIGKAKHQSTQLIKYRECIICGKKYRYGKKYNTGKTCSVECNSKLRSNVAKKSMQRIIATGRHKGWMSRKTVSYPEKFFMEVLKNNNIEYVHNKAISKKELGVNESYNYFLDFALKNKLVLEIDGKQHLVKERVEHDKIRDERLTRAGYKVYRIAWKTLPKNNKYIEKEINNFLMWYYANV